MMQIVNKDISDCVMVINDLQYIAENNIFRPKTIEKVFEIIQKQRGVLSKIKGNT